MPTVSKQKKSGGREMSHKPRQKMGDGRIDRQRHIPEFTLVMKIRDEYVGVIEGHEHHYHAAPEIERWNPFERTFCLST